MKRPTKMCIRDSIFGDATSQAEIELVLATTTALKKICPNNQFEVRINDRKILRAMACLLYTSGKEGRSRHSLVHRHPGLEDEKCPEYHQCGVKQRKGW